MHFGCDASVEAEASRIALSNIHPAFMHLSARPDRLSDAEDGSLTGRRDALRGPINFSRSKSESVPDSAGKVSLKMQKATSALPKPN